MSRARPLCLALLSSAAFVLGDAPAVANAAKDDRRLSRSGRPHVKASVWISLAAFLAVAAFAIPGIAQVPDVGEGVCVMYCGGPKHSTPAESYGPSAHPHAHVNSSGDWTPDDGYRWVNNEPKDFSVVWVPGVLSSVHPHVVAAEMEGTWRPADGYTWVDPTHNDLSVRALEKEGQ